MKHTISVIFILLFSLLPLYAQQPASLGKLLSSKFETIRGNDELLVVIYLNDKGTQSLAATSPRSLLSERAITRRSKVRFSTNPIDEQDLPLEQSYVRSIELKVNKIRHQLKWFNAVSVIATKKQIETMRELSFVKEIELVGRWRTNKTMEQESGELPPDFRMELLGTDTLSYGTGVTQVSQINVPAVHNMGIYGQGIVVGVFDNGFRLPNHEAFASMNIIATYDFVDHKKSVVPNNPSSGFGSHGVNTLSTIGGYTPGQLIGPAFGASYILARTENDSSETPVEEDNWAKAIEWADSIGVDVTSTSLGYLDYDAPYPSWTWQDMNGNTTLITRAADRAVGLGIVVVNSAGNSGSSSHNTLGAPADGDSVISVGAVEASGGRVSFSSIGPTTDVPARIKPDVMAMGSGVKVASSTNPTGYTTSSGTSFSCPLSAGAAALVLSANPALTPMQVRDALRQTASRSSTPDNYMGWGIINTRSAIGYYGINARVYGTAFNDLDADGTKDTNETGIEGALIRISGAVTDSVYTDLNGNYVLDSLPFGNSSINMIPPEGKKLLFPSNGSYGITIDTTRMIQTGKDFVVVEYGKVSGSIFEDINGNGAKGIGDPPVSNWTIKVGTKYLSTQSDSTGNFMFNQVDGGVYSLSESLRTGWNQTAPAGNFTINLNYGQQLSGYQFGVFRAGTIHGLVFEDVNQNGVSDSGETGLSNWQIKLSGPANATVLTDTNGFYTFTNLSAGTYTVRESLTGNWVQIYPSGNGNYSITIQSGTDSANVDFGNYFAPHAVYAINNGWNLISLPQEIENRQLLTVYPSAQSFAFTYQTTYIPNDTVPKSLGYWLKFANSQNVLIIGEMKNSDTIWVKKGWNIIGSISDPVPIANIITEPAGILTSSFYRFNGIYSVVDTLMPHRGHWVKVNSDGMMILQSPVR